MCLRLQLVKHVLQERRMSQAYSHYSAVCLSGTLEINQTKIKCQIRKRRREAGLVGITYHAKHI